jgi:O-antigen ligase
MDIKKVFLSILRYSILVLVILHLPDFALVYLNDSISSLLSYLSYGLIILYVVLNGKSGNNYPMLILGALYFILSSLTNQTYIPDLKHFTITVVKYFIVIWGGYEVMKNTSHKELWFFMFIGALSILGNMFLFNNPLADNGRYSGFYLDPNNAGLICLMGFALSYVMPKKLQFIGKIIFTALGLFTFSRTFIVTWLFINILSIKLSIKNAKMLVFGFALLSGLLVYNEFLPNKNRRLEELGAMISGNERKANNLNKDSRWETWARYYDFLLDKPVFGNGYSSFGTSGLAAPVGVHNTYLLIWGEAGILPLIIFLMYLASLIKRSYNNFRQKPQALMMLLALVLFLMTNHNFLTTGYSLMILLWIHIRLYQKAETEIISSTNLKENIV